MKLKKSDMSTLTRSATMPYPTPDAGALFTVARRLLPDPLQIGPIRLLGVGFSGLSDIRQESLFADSDLTQETAAAHYVETPGAVVPAAHDATMWRVGDDVAHPELGHGWVQGAGHGVVTVRFETRGSGPGSARTFPVDTGDISNASPLDSLDWPDYIGQLSVEGSAGASAPTVDDVGDR
ncbi:DNA-damage-inducible protein P%2C putative [Mycobacterium tuberculosis]|nr:DNA-damage-inducible protein P%2C putative [Mycobacterium tuberculosis]